MPNARVRFIGSRELHRDLPKVLKSLDDTDVRYVLTIHNKPKAVLIGTEAFLELLQAKMPSDRLLALQLGALVQGLISGNHALIDCEEEDGDEPDLAAERQDLVAAV